MVLHNPNNWHWVNKDARPWAREYLEKNLTVINAEEGGVSAKVDKVLSMDGDVDVSQRKGKVITLFDVQLSLEYSGKTKDGEDVTGTISIPEVAHDTEEDEYVYEITNHADESSKQPVKDLVRSKITPQLSKALSKLRDALITEHAKDLQHAPGENPSRGFSPSPVYPQTAKKENQATTTTTKPIANQGPVSTTTVTASDEMRTTAEELYKTFTDPERITLFTRGAPRQFEGAHVGGKFAIFDGNVTGEYVKLNEPTQIVQKWRLADWAPGHYSTLTINFNQVDEYGVTKIDVEWAGVPSDLVEQTKSQWDEKYIRGLKQTFGFGTIL